LIPYRSVVFVLVVAALAVATVVVVARSRNADRDTRSSVSHTSVDLPAADHDAGNLPESEQDFRRLLERLRESVGAGNLDATRQLMAVLSKASSENVDVVWDLLKNDPEPSFALQLGVLLGRIGDHDTLLKVLAESRTIATPDADLGYSGKAGTPSQSRTLLNALVSNALRVFLQRPEHQSLARELAIDFCFDDTVARDARSAALVTVLAYASDDVVLDALAREFENGSKETREDIANAMFSASDRKVSIYLVDWYERFPEHRQRLALAMTRALPVEVAFPLLRERALSELEANPESPALSAIRLLGQRPGSYKYLYATFQSAENLAVKRSLFVAALRADPAAGKQLLIETTRSPEPGLRRLAFERARSVLGATAALLLLVEATDVEKDPSVRGGVWTGLLSIAHEQPRAWDALCKEVSTLRGGKARELLSSMRRVAGLRDETDRLKRSLEDLSAGPLPPDTKAEIAKVIRELSK